MPESLINFVKATGVSKGNAVIEQAFFEHFVRDDLNKKSRRVMAVLDPLKVVITNFEGEEENVQLKNYPQNKESTIRNYKFGKELFIEREDFSANPPPKYRRLVLGGEVRLMGAYIIKATSYDEDKNGNVTCVYAEYDKTSKSGTEGARKTKGTIHWVNKNLSKKIECRLVNNLIKTSETKVQDFEEEDEGEKKSKEYDFNPNSLEIVEGALIESYVELDFEQRYQFLRKGYFALDPDSTQEKLVFNRTITLRQ